MSRNRIVLHAEDERGEVIPNTEVVIDAFSWGASIPFIRAFRAIVPSASLKETKEFWDAFRDAYDTLVNNNRLGMIDQIKECAVYLTHEEMVALATELQAKKRAVMAKIQEAEYASED